MRKAIKQLKPYRVPNNKGYIRLDNNECLINLIEQVEFKQIQDKLTINRYPSYTTEQIIEAYSKYVGFPKEKILVGNGSDELISLISQYALDPEDTIVVMEPDFSMYGKNAMIMGANVISLDLNKDFTLPVEKIVSTIKKTKAKLFFLSNPHNPTGMFYGEEQINEINQALQKVGGIFVLDEAYIEFSGGSFVSKLSNYENVIVLRTASKALGMAGLRLGFLLSSEKIINEIECIKPPYNVNILSALIGTNLLNQTLLLKESLAIQFKQKEELELILSTFVKRNPGVIMYPSKTNYFLLELEDPKGFTDFLNKKKIKIRLFQSGRLKSAVRISTGTMEQHQALQFALEEWSELHAYSLKK